MAKKPRNVKKSNKPRKARQKSLKRRPRIQPRQRTRKSKARGKAAPRRPRLAGKAPRQLPKRTKPVRQSGKNTTRKTHTRKPSKVRGPGNLKAVKPRLSGKGKRPINKNTRLVSKPRKKKGRKVIKKARGERFSYNLDVPNNRIDIFLPHGSFKKKIDAIRNSPFECLTPLQEKTTYFNEEEKKAWAEKIGRQWLPFPQAVLTTLTSQREVGEHDEKKEFFRNKITPVDLVINNESVKAFVIEQMINYQDNWIEMKDEKDPEDMEGYELQANPAKLFKIRINYIY